MTTWNIDTTHSSIQFSIRHLVIAKVRGTFDKWQGTITTEANGLASAKAKVEIEAASINTNEEKRDAHLRSGDFFETEKFPKLTFESKKVELAGGKVAKVTGDLSIHGVTKEIVLEVEDLGEIKDPWGNQRVAFSASTTINRHDFGLQWNQALELGGVAVGEKVEISLDVQAVKAA